MIITEYLFSMIFVILFIVMLCINFKLKREMMEQHKYNRDLQNKNDELGGIVSGMKEEMRKLAESLGKNINKLSEENKAFITTIIRLSKGMKK